ncbi:MAG: ParB N-terminal domain-containing protein [Planctomycetota bacterium]
MNDKSTYTKTIAWLLLWVVLAAACFIANFFMNPNTLAPTQQSEILDSAKDNLAGLPPLHLAGIILVILAFTSFFKLITVWYFKLKRKPLAEGLMIGRIYTLIAVLAILFSLAYGFGKLTTFSAFFAMFGGMLLGFSLQAPVSGFAAWVLVSLKRPFRPGDRVQFPNLSLTGDVLDIGIMYTVLNQVGGSIGSEEAVGRYILVPNAMLFSQVAINYTVAQDSAYILDEVVVRITFNSHWDTAEKLMLNAATKVTQDIIETTGVKPYIRSDLYDYGVYLRLRYQTSVKERAEIAYKINKMIFEAIQHTPEVDLAIPYVYSARAGARVMAKQKEDEMDSETNNIHDIEIAQIQTAGEIADIDVIEQLSQSIATHGLLQPIMLIPNPQGKYDVVAGQLRLEACKRLGWKKIPAVIRGLYGEV